MCHGKSHSGRNSSSTISCHSLLHSEVCEVLCPTQNVLWSDEKVWHLQNGQSLHFKPPFPKAINERLFATELLGKMIRGRPVALSDTAS